MEFHDAHSQNLNGWFSFRLTCSKLLFCSFWAYYKYIAKAAYSHKWNEWRLTLPPRLSLDCQVTLKNNAIITIDALKIIMGYPWVSSARDSPTLKIQQKIIESKSQSSFPNIQHAKSWQMSPNKRRWTWFGREVRLDSFRLESELRPLSLPSFQRSWNKHALFL